MLIMVLGRKLALACVFALLERGMKDIIIVGRTPDHLQSILDFFSSPDVSGISWPERNKPTHKPSLLINATPLGLPGTAPFQFDFEKVKPGAVVYDLVYGRRETAFVKAAIKAGLKTIDGLGMLIFQAIPAFEAWFGKRPAHSREVYDMLATKAE